MTIFKQALVFGAFVGALLTRLACGSDEVTIYPFAAGLPQSLDCRLTVAGRDVFVHRTDVADFAMFALAGKVEVQVEWKREVKSAVVRPLARRISPKIAGRVVRFSVDGPGPLSLEVNDDIRRPLFLFVDPPETNALNAGSPGVRYFEGGKIHDAGEIRLNDNETLYLAPGAVVRGTIRAANVRGVRILGRGILDGRLRTHKAKFVSLQECRDVELRDLLVLGSYGWTLVPSLSSDITLRNVKVFSWRDNDDGLDICGCRNIEVDGCFFRTKDDCIAIKAPSGDRAGKFDVDGVRVQRSVFWNAEWGNAMEIGFELRTARIGNIVWSDCDVIREEKGAVFSIHNGDWAEVADVRFEKIRVEDARAKLLDIRVGLSIYSSDCPERYHRRNPQRQPTGDGQWVPLAKLTAAERAGVAGNRGRIRGIRLDDIELLGETIPKSSIIGFEDVGGVEDIVITGLRHKGQPLDDAAAARIEGPAAPNVLFRRVTE